MECPHYEFDEELNEPICHASQDDECPKEHVNKCKYQPQDNLIEEYYGEFGLY